MTLKDYPITFPYGATSAPYSATRPHRGNDRAAPLGTPIVIGDTTIGLVGSTGLSSGSHCHTQAGTDKACQDTFNPSPLEFKGGTVVNTGFGSEWGKFVTIQVGKEFITYAHMSEIGVQINQVIKENAMTQAEVAQDYAKVGRTATAADKVLHSTKGTHKSLHDGLMKDFYKYGYGKQIRSLEAQLVAVKKALANEKNKPPQTVIKEVEKIVEKEVIKEVPVGEEEAVRGFFGRLLDLVFKK
jgi:hypothetical protein